MDFNIGAPNQGNPLLTRQRTPPQRIRSPAPRSDGSSGSRLGSTLGSSGGGDIFTMEEKFHSPPLIPSPIFQSPPPLTVEYSRSPVFSSMRSPPMRLRRHSSPLLNANKMIQTRNDNVSRELMSYWPVYDEDVHRYLMKDVEISVVNIAWKDVIPLGKELVHFLLSDKANDHSNNEVLAEIRALPQSSRTTAILIELLKHSIAYQSPHVFQFIFDQLVVQSRYIQKNLNLFIYSLVQYLVFSLNYRLLYHILNHMEIMIKSLVTTPQGMELIHLMDDMLLTDDIPLTVMQAYLFGELKDRTGVARSISDQLDDLSMSKELIGLSDEW